MPARRGQIPKAGKPGALRRGRAGESSDRAMAGNRGPEVQSAEHRARLLPLHRPNPSRKPGSRGNPAIGREQEEAREGSQSLRPEARRQQLPGRKQIHARRSLSPPQRRAADEDDGNGGDIQPPR